MANNLRVYGYVYLYVPKQVNQFCFASFLTRAEIVRIIVAVRGEGAKVGALRWHSKHTCLLKYMQVHLSMRTDCLWTHLPARWDKLLNLSTKIPMCISAPCNTISVPCRVNASMSLLVTCCCWKTDIRVHSDFRYVCTWYYVCFAPSQSALK